MPISSQGSTVPKVNVKGVKCYVSNGIAYAYDRKTGTRLTPPHPIGSDAWYAALAAARAKLNPRSEEKAGTWGGLVAIYRDSSRFRHLAARTQSDYHGVLNYLRPVADVGLHRWTSGFVAALRDKAERQRGRRFANYVLSVVSVVFAVGIEREIAEVNPVRDVAKLRRRKDAPRANRPWDRSEWDVVVAAASPVLLAPILLGGILGYREGEAITSPRPSWNRTTRTLTRISAKSGKVVKVPAPAAIAEALAALPTNTATTLLVNSHARPWTLDGFRGSFFRLIRNLKATGKVGEGLTFHGLRHTAATRMRELGFDTRTVADMLGQETEGMAAHYSREADLGPKLAGVVRRLERANKPSTKVSKQPDNKCLNTEAKSAGKATKSL